MNAVEHIKTFASSHKTFFLPQCFVAWIIIYNVINTMWELYSMIGGGNLAELKV